MFKIGLYIVLILSVVACQSKQQKTNISKEERARPKGSYQRNLKGIVNIETYDHYNRLLKKGYGFYISSKTLVTNLDLIKGSYKAKVAIVGTDDYRDVAGYTAYDVDKDLVILKTWKENLNYLHLEKSIKNIPDSIVSLYRKSRKTYLPKLSVKKSVADSALVYTLSKRLPSALPAFTFLHHPVGIVMNKKTGSKTSILVPSSQIISLSKKQLKQ